MLSIDTNKMLIELTRGDYCAIEFSAVDDEDTEYTPTTGDKLTFAVAKKVGADPIFSITNTYDGVDSDAFWTIEIGTAGSTHWYQKDDNGNVIYEDGEPVYIKFGDYVWDVQLQTPDGLPQTIIGKTDDLSPKFRVWGEVAQNG